MIYLVHLNIAMEMDERRAARHYIGFVDESRSREALVERMALHRANRGSRFLAAANERGIGWRLAAVYRGDRNEERRLKNVRNSARICPICEVDIAVNPRAGSPQDRIRLGIPVYAHGLLISPDCATSLRRIGCADLLPRLQPYL